MGVFEFIIALTIISTIGKVLRGHPPVAPPPDQLPAPKKAELEQIRDSLSDLSDRLHRLEEERDFYKDLLESPKRARQIEAPAPPPPAAEPETGTRTTP